MVRLAVLLVLALPPPGVHSNAGWHTVTKGQQLFALTAKANADALTPFDGLKKLGPSDALIWATTVRKGAFPHPFRSAAWPPRLRDFRIDHAWEGQPLPRIEQRLLALTTHGWTLDVRVYFGTQHPTMQLLGEVQAELGRLTLPRLTHLRRRVRH